MVIAQLVRDKVLPADSNGNVKQKKVPTIPLPTSDHPEDDTTDPLDDKEHRTYQRFIGIIQWIRFLEEQIYATASLSRFNSAPRRGHLERVYEILGYLQARPK